MFDSLEAIADSVYQELQGGKAVDDTRLSLEMVVDEIKTVRLEVLGTLLEKGRKLDDLWSTKCCIELKCQEICDSGVQELYGVLPSSIISVGKGTGIKYIGTADGKAFSRNEYANALPLMKKKPTFSFEDNKVIIKNAPTGLRKIIIRAVWADVDGCECIGMRYPIPSAYIGMIKKKAKYNLSEVIINRRTDNRNDRKANN